MEFVLAAISLGFFGSFHCIGMCGPIALSLPVHQKTPVEKNLSILAYNIGRITTYSLFGVLFGLIGQSFALFGYQQKLSVVIGLLILIWLFLPKSIVSRLKFANGFYVFFAKVKNALAQQFQKRGIRSFFSIGMLNGLLPCGLVYMALAGAIATGDTLKAMLFMALFGAGTIPFMFAITYTSHLITLRARNVIRKAMPVVIGVMAVLLVLRGLNLGISYISPKITIEKTADKGCQKKVNCCHKK